ncbi:MAG: SOS response-associated peptidase family protein [Gelidibacter sp.]
MFYKLSNTADRKDIEKEFNVSFEFPRLYKTSPVINGLEEVTLPIITMEHPNQVSYSIWGLLPQSLEDNWKVFQNLTNTLNINVEHLDFKDALYSEAMDKRRCLIITTGFFTSALYKGKMYPYHVYLSGQKPFGIAGVYNQLEDGFLTCSILIKKTNDSLKEIPNLLEYKPVIFDARDRMHWLNENFSYDALKDLVSSHQTLQYHSHPVSKEYYDNDILYNKIMRSNAFNDFLNTSE